jgi:hypothetical protein
MQTEHTSPSGGSDDLDLLDADASTSTTSVSSDAIPAKYAGKSVDEIIKMHQNAEKKISEQGKDLAAQRRMSDAILELKATKQPETRTTEVARKPVTVEALLNDPEKAIRDAVDGSDMGRRAEAAEARTATLEATIAEQSFSSKHKDFASDINDPDFIAWVNKNPLRQALANETAKKNFQAASNLWDLWDEHKELVTGKDAVTTAAASKKVPTTVKSSPVENQGKTVYSRAKLMELRAKVEDGNAAAVARWKDPTFQDNLVRAYAEGRVK